MQLRNKDLNDSARKELRQEIEQLKKANRDLPILFPHTKEHKEMGQNFLYLQKQERKRLNQQKREDDPTSNLRLRFAARHRAKS